MCIQYSVRTWSKQCAWKKHARAQVLQCRGWNRIFAFHDVREKSVLVLYIAFHSKKNTLYTVQYVYYIFLIYFEYFSLIVSFLLRWVFPSQPSLEKFKSTSRSFSCRRRRSWAAGSIQHYHDEGRDITPLNHSISSTRQDVLKTCVYTQYIDARDLELIKLVYTQTVQVVQQDGTLSGSGIPLREFICVMEGASGEYTAAAAWHQIHQLYAHLRFKMVVIAWILHVGGLRSPSYLCRQWWMKRRTSDRIARYIGEWCGPLYHQDTVEIRYSSYLQSSKSFNFQDHHSCSLCCCCCSSSLLDGSLRETLKASQSYLLTSLIHTHSRRIQCSYQTWYRSGSVQGCLKEQETAMLVQTLDS